MEQSSTEISPYYARITFHIDIFPMMQDGSIHPAKLPISELEAHNITNTAVFGITGFTKEDCINKLLEVLKKLEYEK
jgi:hypothetical protein